METMVDRLLAELDKIVEVMDELLDASTIDYVDNRARREARSTGVLFAGLADGKWGPSSDQQKSLQRRLLGAWNPWLEQVRLLFSEDTTARQREIEQACSQLQAWIQRDDYTHSIPPTIPEAKKAFKTVAEPLASTLRSLGQGPGCVLVVPDTNVLLRSPDIIKYGAVLDEATAYTVLLVPGVLGEMDGHKVNHRNPAVRERARKFTNRIKGWRGQGSLSEGVKVKGDIYVQVEGREPNLDKTLSWLQSDVVDDRILASILEVQRRCPTDRVVLLTGDTLMLAKADAASVPTADTPDPDL